MKGMKKIKSVCLLVVLSLTGCYEQPAIMQGDSYELRYVPCTQAEREAVAKSVAEICQASASQATHSAEDMIKQAQHTAMQSLCVPTKWRWNGYMARWDPVEERCFGYKAEDK